MTLLRITAVFLALALAAWPARASHKNQGDQGGRGNQSQPAVTTGSDVADIVFGEVERRIIEDYFGIKPVQVEDDDYGKGKGKHKNKGRGKSKQFPPGLAKRGHLPPGLAKRSQLPPGLAKRDIPPELAAQLGFPPQGTERAIVDNNVVLIETATGLVLDILQGVLTGAK